MMLETIFRTKSALQQLHILDAEAQNMADQWLRFMLQNTNPYDAENRVTYTLDAAGTDITLDVTQNRKNLAKQYLEFMQLSKLPEIEQKVFFKAVKSLGGNLHVWLQMAYDSQTTGWSVTGIIPCDEVWGYVSDNVEPLLKPFLAENGINACTAMGRACSGNANTLLRFELGGESIDDDMQLCILLFQSLKIAPIPSPILDLVSEQNPDYIEAALQVSTNGVLKAGIRVPLPSSDLVLQLATALGNADTASLIGTLEGNLDTDEATAIEIYRTASGIELQVVYEREEEEA